MSASSSDDAAVVEYLLGLHRSGRERTDSGPDSVADLGADLGVTGDALTQLSLAEVPRRPSAELRERVLAPLTNAEPLAGFVDRLTRFFDLGADKVRDLLAATTSAQGTNWDTTTMPGAQLLHFDGGSRVATADCGLVNVPPGRAVPLHRHKGDEWTLVLGGRAQDDSGREFAAGDLCHCTQGSTHRLVVIGDEPLVFAIVVHEGVEWLEEADASA